jgi:catalase (peroxidase I)
MMLVSDMVLLWDEDFKRHLEVYAAEENTLRDDFGVAFKKLTELGFSTGQKGVSEKKCPFAHLADLPC